MTAADTVVVPAWWLVVTAAISFGLALIMQSAANAAAWRRMRVKPAEPAKPKLELRVDGPVSPPVSPPAPLTNPLAEPIVESPRLIITGSATGTVTTPIAPPPPPAPGPMPLDELLEAERTAGLDPKRLNRTQPQPV